MILVSLSGVQGFVVGPDGFDNICGAVRLPVEYSGYVCRYAQRDGAGIAYGSGASCSGSSTAVP